jgi:hypothetical protein
MATNIAPPPPPQKSNTLLWVLVGCGGLLLLIGMVVVGGIAYVAHNPARFMTKMITAANPNVEVVSVDNGSQRITLRDKKTGKVYNITFNDAKNGRFSMSSDDHASFNIGGRAKVPAWVPDYPNSSPQASFSAQGNEGNTGTFSFKTSDSSEKVIKFYQDGFQSSGLKITTNMIHQEGQSSTGVMAAEDDAKKHTVTVVIGMEGRDTTVQLTYAAKK